MSSTSEAAAAPRDTRDTERTGAGMKVNLGDLRISGQLPRDTNGKTLKYQRNTMILMLNLQKERSSLLVG